MQVISFQVAIDNVANSNPSAHDLRAALLKAAGMESSKDVEWSEARGDEVMKKLGRDKLWEVMRDVGKLDPDVIKSELAHIDERLRKLEEKVSSLHQLL